MPVKLDGVNVELLEQAQGGEAHAKVVQGAEKAVVVHVVQTLFDGGEFVVVKEDGFRQLKVQQTTGNLVFLGHLNKGFQEGGVLEIMLPGKVEGNGQEMPSLPLPPLQGLADLGEHVQVQLANLSVAFKEGNEVRGENHPLFGMEPADQGLGTAYHTSVQTYLGLQVELEVAPFEGVLEQHVQLLLLEQPVDEGLVIEDAEHLFRHRMVIGKVGVVLQLDQFVGSLVHQSDATVEFQIVGRVGVCVKGIDFCGDMVQAGFYDLGVTAFQAEEEVVGAEAGRKLIWLEAFFYAAADVPDGVVTLPLLYSR